MLKSLQKAFKVKEVRDRLLYTFMMLVVIRIGCCLPIPGVDPSYLHDFFSNLQNSGMGFFNAITGCLLYTSDAADDRIRVDLGGGGCV